MIFWFEVAVMLTVTLLSAHRSKLTENDSPLSVNLRSTHGTHGIGTLAPSPILARITWTTVHILGIDCNDFYHFIFNLYWKMINSLVNGAEEDSRIAIENFSNCYLIAFLIVYFWEIVWSKLSNTDYFIAHLQSNPLITATQGSPKKWHQWESCITQIKTIWDLKRSSIGWSPVVS